jgi:hypothetical protein
MLRIMANLEPGDVWKMIVRADELVKYAPNRDAADAYRQAREVLESAAVAARSLADEAASKSFVMQVETRLSDLARREAGEV